MTTTFLSCPFRHRGLVILALFWRGGCLLARVAAVRASMVAAGERAGQRGGGQRSGGAGERGGGWQARGQQGKRWGRWRASVPRRPASHHWRRNLIETTRFFPTVKSQFLRASIRETTSFPLEETVSSIFYLFLH